jgi:cyclic 2,3-diphosphoglycerate synthase
VRTLVLVDGEHYPAVVRAAVADVPDVAGAALLGGGEKLPAGGLPDIGVPVVTGSTPDEALQEGLRVFAPELVVDLSDEPVVDGRTRLRLAARTLAYGIPYAGPDFRFDPPSRPRLATKPSLAVIGTGKRTGKTAVSAAMARVLAGNGMAPVVVAMGRGGPAEPELVDPTTFDLTPKGLLALADSGRHAASDHLEDALTAGVVTVGTRRCGGGMAGAPAATTFAAGVELANGRPESLLVFEGSGQAVPPVHADATVCVVPAFADPELVVGYLGAYRILLSDLIVITMVDRADGGVVALQDLENGVRRLAPGARVVHTVFRPSPLEPISGGRVVFATTAPLPALSSMVEHLQREHDCVVVATSHHLAQREQLSRDLDAAPDADVLLVELKAAAVDVAVRSALARGMEVVFCATEVQSVGGDGQFDDLVVATAGLAMERSRQ